MPSISRNYPVIHRLIPLLGIVVVFVLIFDLAKGWFTINSDSTLVNHSPEPFREVKSHSSPVPRNYDLASLHLFGTVQKQEVKKQPEIPKLENIPKSTLPLTISGIVWSTNKKNENLVILSQANRDESVFSEGDKLPGGAQLVEIHQHAVIIKKQGKHEQIALPRLDESRASSMRISPALRNVAQIRKKTF